jgi:hypothetical protein
MFGHHIRKSPSFTVFIDHDLLALVFETTVARDHAYMLQSQHRLNFVSDVIGVIGQHLCSKLHTKALRAQAIHDRLAPVTDLRQYRVLILVANDPASVRPLDSPHDSPSRPSVIRILIVWR